MTLLERRKATLKAVTEDLVDATGALPRMKSTGETLRQLVFIAAAAGRALRVAHQVDDLESIEKYGPEGGR